MVEILTEYGGALNDGDILWRYLDLPKFLALLLDKELFFPNAHFFTGDKLEGTLPTEQREALQQTLTTTSAETSRIFIEGLSRSIYFVSCWYQSEGESEAMWRLNSPVPSEGIAIKTTVDRLRYCVGNPAVTVEGEKLSAFMGRVGYGQPSVWSKPDSGFVRDLVMNKRSAFKHENEVRVVLEGGIDFLGAGKFDLQDFLQKIGLQKGSGCSKCDVLSLRKNVTVPVNLNDLIDRIHLSPHVSSMVSHVVHELVDALGLNPNKVRDSELKGTI